MPVVAVAVLAYVGALPWVHIRPETAILDAAARLFGGQDIELESEDFNRRLLILTGLCERLPHYGWSDRGLSPPPAQGRTV